MLKNYLKIAWRNLKKHKIDSFISITGLGVGLACCILLVTYVRFEWSHDDFHEWSDQIYRITMESSSPRDGVVQKSLATPYPLNAALDSTFPEIEQVIDVMKNRVYVQKAEEFIPELVLFADPGFFELFTFPILYGNNNIPLSENDAIVITEQFAQLYFGHTQVVGELLTIRLGNEEYDYRVSAVAKNPPANSSIQFGMVIPYESYFNTMNPDRERTFKNNWFISSGETWLLLGTEANPDHLIEKFPELLKTNLGKNAEMLNSNMGLQSLNEAYFDQQYTSMVTGSTNIRYSLILGGIAVVILAIAGINFMSLTLSRANMRHHEIGIRKSIGAQQKQIVYQVFGEVFVTCSLAFLFGLLLAEMAIPLFQDITNSQVELGIFGDPYLLFLLVGVLLAITIITGLYPAIHVSRKKATQLFSSQRSAERIPLLVKSLICVQFALSIAFLIAAVAMQKQLNYISNKDMGFAADNVISVELNMRGSKAVEAAELFSREAQRIPGVEMVGITASRYRQIPSFAPREISSFGMGTMRSSTTLEGFDQGITSEVVDEHFLETLNIKLLEGRNFSQERPSELKTGIIINEKFAEVMGWANPVGQIINDDTESWQAPFDGKEVIGVVENFHFESFYHKIRPLALTHLESSDFSDPGTILIKAANSSMSETIERLSSLWDQLLPEETFTYSFLDELAMLQYREEQRWNRIMDFSSAIAIILACFGLFGLAALSAQRRIKEIGIRKVFGATVTNIVTLINKDFLKLVVIGFVISVPAAWYVMNSWLTDFAYRIDLGAGIFLLAGGIALFIALATVSWQSVRAAVANPVDSLRSE
ncbi:MAG TPA: ABC transporter permease [Halalkalibaculum sp.]|nr:ABC transporter permease [Halalkalibaculum sp.]